MAQLWQTDRDRAGSAILKGWVTFRLNFKLKGYVLRQYLWNVRYGNGYKTTLPLEVFKQRNIVADFILLKLTFSQKGNKKSVFEPPFRALKGNVRTRSIARWKARGRLPICQNWTFSVWSRRYKRQSVEVGVFRRGWVNLSANFRRKGTSPTNHCWWKQTRVIALSCGIKIVHCLVWSQSTRVTDWQTELRQLIPR